MSDEQQPKVNIEVVGEWRNPSDEAVHGEKRLVRYLPVGLPGEKAPLMLPCVWMSPYKVYDEDLKTEVKIGLVLLSKGPPRAEVVQIRIPADSVDKFPMGPVEW